MKFIEKTVEKLLNTSYEDFTSFCLLSVSMAKADEHFEIADLERMEWLISNVNEKLQTSIYKLDRFVDPLNLSTNPTKYSYPVTFHSDYLLEENTNNKLLIKIPSEDLQKELCKAIEEINMITFKHLNGYNEDFIMPKTNPNAKEEDF
jgi:hypothetical protein